MAECFPTNQNAGNDNLVHTSLQKLGAEAGVIRNQANDTLFSLPLSHHKR